MQLASLEVCPADYMLMGDGLISTVIRGRSGQGAVAVQYGVQGAPDGHENFPEDLSVLSQTGLHRLHTKACQAVDFEYFFADPTPATRLRYRLLNAEIRRRESAGERH